MSWFRNMDLYKAIILLSLLLLPASLGYYYWVESRLKVAQDAMKAATKPDGELEKIAELCQNLATVQSNATRGEDSVSARLFFERTILDTASDGGVQSNDLRIGDPQEGEVRRDKATDIEVRVDLREGTKAKKLTRQFIAAMLYNCEEGGAQVWKLRSATLTNAQAGEFRGRSKEAPPKTIDDVWEITDLTFARRVPQRSSR